MCSFSAAAIEHVSSHLSRDEFREVIHTSMACSAISIFLNLLMRQITASGDSCCDCIALAIVYYVLAATVANRFLSNGAQKAAPTVIAIQFALACAQGCVQACMHSQSTKRMLYGGSSDCSSLFDQDAKVPAFLYVPESKALAAKCLYDSFFMGWFGIISPVNYADEIIAESLFTDVYIKYPRILDLVWLDLAPYTKTLTHLLLKLLETALGVNVFQGSGSNIFGSSLPFFVMWSSAVIVFVKCFLHHILRMIREDKFTKYCIVSLVGGGILCTFEAWVVLWLVSRATPYRNDSLGGKISTRVYLFSVIVCTLWTAVHSVAVYSCVRELYERRCRQAVCTWGSASLGATVFILMSSTFVSWPMVGALYALEISGPDESKLFCMYAFARRWVAYSMDATLDAMSSLLEKWKSVHNAQPQPGSNHEAPRDVPVPNRRRNQPAQNPLVLPVAPIVPARNPSGIPVAPIVPVQNPLVLPVAPIVPARNPSGIPVAPIVPARNRSNRRVAPIVPAQNPSHIPVAAIVGRRLDKRAREEGGSGGGGRGSAQQKRTRTVRKEDVNALKQILIAAADAIDEMKNATGRLGVSNAIFDTYKNQITISFCKSVQELFGTRDGQLDDVLKPMLDEYINDRNKLNMLVEAILPKCVSQ
jgi:hypothetical protein